MTVRLLRKRTITTGWRFEMRGGCAGVGGGGSGGGGCVYREVGVVVEIAYRLLVIGEVGVGVLLF